MEDGAKRLIEAFLRREALGRENAVPRRVLQNYLAEKGYPISDRTMRRFYSSMPFIGYAIDGQKRGLFWIATAAEAFECERLRKSQGKACLAHGAETAKAHGRAGQMDLFGRMVG